MKFLLMICPDESIKVSPEEASAHDWVEEMDGRGVRLRGHALRPAAEGRAVRVRDGEVLVGDGPFAETKEQVGGVDIIECATLEEAVEVAARHPVARFGSVEVREFDEVTGATAEVEVRVPLPPSEVWDLVTDLSRLGEWSPECTRASWLEPDAGPRAGARFQASNRYPNGFVADVTCVVTRADRPHGFAWEVLDGSGVPGSLWSYDLRPGSEPGQTLLRHTFVHGPGNTGLRVAARRSGADASTVIDGRLTALRANMTATIRAMTGSPD
ncbi:SRPBCC family protein [Nonomuraea sp. NPDC000554]|uniref:SRPBCC family protein n=1 Tax=Nonomuraea sp. NPDC000554 TaxID=3154259 RepID=UPI0033349E75